MGKTKAEKAAEKLKKAEEAAAKKAAAQKSEKKEEKPADKPVEKKEEVKPDVKPEDKPKTPPKSENKPADKPIEKKSKAEAGDKKEPKKEDKKEKVEEAVAETIPSTTPATISEPFDGTAGSLARMLGLGFNKNMRISEDSRVTLLAVTQKILEKDPNPNSTMSIVVNEMFHEQHAYVLLRAQLQMYHDLGQMRAIIPAKTVQYALSVFTNLGVIIPEDALKSIGDGSQLELNFDKTSIQPAAKEKLEKENAIEAGTPPNLNPNEWKTDEDCIKGIQYILTNTGEDSHLNLFKAIEGMKTYRQNMEKDANQKKLWDKIPKGDVLKDMFDLLKEVPTVVESGIGSTLRNMIKVHKCPVTAHCKIKVLLPQYSDEDVASIVRVMIEKQAPAGTKLEEYKPYLFLVTGDREEFLDMVENPAEKDSMDGSRQKAMVGKLRETYREELGAPNDPKFPVKVANKAIEIVNYYRTPEERMALYEEKGYPAKPAESEKPKEEAGAAADTTPATSETPPTENPADGATGS